MAEKKSTFTAEERAAMRERAKEAKVVASKAGDVANVLEKISELDAPDRELATRLHELVTRVAPQLDPKPWYGSPAYYRDGRVVCFFQGASKYGTRYATFGFQEAAALDDGAIWPTSYALVEWTPAVETLITDLVTRAAGQPALRRP
jgi:uncharacterized protein YdhG (YjbR/CyaY superfamily)